MPLYLACIALWNCSNIFTQEQLEDKVNKHNQVIERTYRLEENEALLEERVRVANHRIDDLEKFHKPH